MMGSEENEADRLCIIIAIYSSGRILSVQLFVGVKSSEAILSLTEHR